MDIGNMVTANIAPAGQDMVDRGSLAGLAPTALLLPKHCWNGLIKSTKVRYRKPMYRKVYGIEFPRPMPTKMVL